MPFRLVDFRCFWSICPAISVTAVVFSQRRVAGHSTVTVAEPIVTGRPLVHSTVKYAKVGFCGSLLLFFAYKKLLGRTETRTRDMIYCQTIRTVRDISRDDRARIATCSLRTPTDRHTDRLKAHYSIDDASLWVAIALASAGLNITAGVASQSILTRRTLYSPTIY